MFETLVMLDVDFFCFHDLDIAPEGKSLKEFNANVTEIAKIFEKKMAATNKKLLWGTANMFSNRRFMAGAATNPDPDVFAYCAAQVKHCLDVTKDLDGANYVMWGGREGYETLLNTNIGHELEQAKRFLSMVVEYKHKIGFKGPILLEPKPQEPTKHQYDYDVATCYAMIASLGLQNDVKLNVEQNHAILAGHTFEHEIALASALGVFGSIDINRGDYQSGWDTDQFAMNIPEMSLAFLEILKAGGFTTGGLNFDAKIRRQSIDPEDLLHAHVGSIDACARGLLIAAKILEDGKLGKIVDDRYGKWNEPKNQAMLKGKETLDSIASARSCRRPRTATEVGPPGAARKPDQLLHLTFREDLNTWQPTSRAPQFSSRNSQAMRPPSIHGTRSRNGPPRSATRACRSRPGTAA